MADEELDALRERILTLADTVESVFAEAILALVEGDFRVAREVQLEDYKAHKLWLETDALCIGLLAGGKLDTEQVRFVACALKVAMDLKRIADEAVFVSRCLDACPEGELPPGPWSEVLPRMADLAQSLFTNSVESMVNRDPALAATLQPTFKELTALNARAVREANEELASEAPTTPRVQTTLVLVAHAFEHIGQHALDVAHHVRHLSSGPPAQDSIPPDEA